MANETELKVIQGSTLSFPVTLSQSAQIESIDIDITGYNSAVAEFAGATLTGGVLENKNYILKHTIVGDKINIIVYAGGTLITGSGDFVFLNFSVKTDGAATLSLTRFESNEIAAGGGFYIKDAVFQTLKISINRPPVAEPATLETDEDKTLSSTLKAKDADNDLLTYTVADKPLKGAVEITDKNTGAFTYTPNANENGTDSFTFKADDGTEISAAGKISITIKAANDAPKLDSSFSPKLSSIAGDNKNSAGDSVASIVVDGSVTDADLPAGTPAPEAIAVIGIDNTKGLWQYSLDNGATWTSFTTQTGSVNISTAARLLDSSHKIRFVPSDPFWSGTAELVFRAWDRTAGTAGQTADASAGGGISPFSESADSAGITVTAANHAPVLDASKSPKLTQIISTDTTGAGDTVAGIIEDGSITDPDATADKPAPEAIAVVSVDNTNGKWQYSLDGATWTDFTATAGIADISANARLLDATHKIRFAPKAADWEGTATFTFRAWDKTKGAAGETSDASKGGETSPFSEATDSASITVIPANHAPELDVSASPALSYIRINETAPAGDTVANIIADGSIADVDAATDKPAPESVAVVSLDNSNGKWQYSLDNGATWNDFTASVGVTDISKQARLLDESHKIRFVPKADWIGESNFTFRAWDKSAGSSGGTADAGVVGGFSAFSSAQDTASVQVKPVNNAPKLDITKSPPRLSDILENEVENEGDIIAEMIMDGFITDIDAGEGYKAIAVISADNTNGLWQYSPDDGKTWYDFTDVSGSNADMAAKALLLAETYRIRFIPNLGWFGTAQFTFRAWDKSTGFAGGTANASAGGGFSAFSESTDFVKIKVKPLNHAPVLDVSQSPALSAINKNSFESSGDAVGEIIPDGSITDADVAAAPESIAVVAVDNTHGFWQYSLDKGVSWKDFSDTAGSIVELSAQARLLESANKIRFVPDEDWSGAVTFTFRAWDKTAGTGGSTADASKGGETSPFSLDTDTAQITVKDQANHAPELDASQSPALSKIKVNAFDNKGNIVAEIIPDGSITDSDGNVSESIAVIAADNSNGRWQYSSDGGATWKVFTTQTGVADISDKVVLLDETYRVRFVPNQDWGGTASFNFRAWDKTAGVAGATADTRKNGGYSAFSLASDEAAILVNDDPLANAGADQTVNEKSSVTLDGSASSGLITTYRWTQIEGTSVTISDPDAVRVSFTVPNVESGEVLLTFRLTAKGLGTLESSDTVTVTVLDIPAPAAAFTAMPTSGNVPLDAAFTDVSQGSVREWKWDFGDGFQSIEQHPLHTYASAGTYTVKLTVKGPGGESSATQNDYITVINVPLKSDFHASPSTGFAPLDVSFVSKAEGSISDWRWDFGNGKTSSGAKAVHRYETPGKYSVSLTVTGPEGAKTETKPDYIVVEGRSIAGKVIAGDTQAGMSDCRIDLWQGDVSLRSVKTDSNGNYTIADLPAVSNFYLQASPPSGANYFYQFYNGKSNRQKADAVSTLETSSSDINFILERMPTEGITGRVHDGKSNGIAGASVNVFSESITFGLNVVSDAEGYYTVKGLKPASDYLVSVWSDELQTEFYYAIPKDQIPGENSPTYSVFATKNATMVKPTEPPLPNIDMIVSADTGGSIKGSVYLADGKTPVKGISVNAWSEEMQSGNSVKTDENGAYTVWGIEEVSSADISSKGYIVEILSANYPYQAYNRVSKKTDATRVGTGESGIDFYLKAGYAISGTVTDEDGNPFSGAEAAAWSAAAPQKTGAAATDERGDYRIPDLPVADDYIVKVFASGYPPQYYNLKADEDSADSVDITQGDAEHIDFALNKGAIITGVVYLGDKPASAGIWVSIWSESTRTGGDVQTDEQGRYEIAGLEEDITDYVISVRHPGYVPAFYHQEGAVYKWEDAQRVPPSEEDRNISLITGFAIRGKVTYNDSPVGGISVEAVGDVSVSGKTTESFQTSEASEKFNYAVTGLLPGDYEVSISPANFMSETKSIVIENQDVVLDFVLADLPERQVSGTVTGLAKDKKAEIRISSLSKNISASVKLIGTDNPLDYTVSGLKSANDYVAEFISNDYPYQIYKGRYKFENADLIDLSEKDASDIDFTLSSETAEISGEVIFPADALSGEAVWVGVVSESLGSGGGTDVVMNDSRVVPYLVTGLIPAQDYVVFLYSDKYISHFYDGTAQGALKAAYAKEIDVTDAEEDIVNFYLSEGVSISGRVTDGNGDGVAGIKIEAWSALTGQHNSTVALSDGYYMLKGLGPANDYTIEARDPNIGSFYYNIVKTVRDRALATRINTGDGDAANINIVLGEVESISGAVSDKDGYPLLRMWVDARSELQQSGNGTFTDEYGKYEIKGLPKSRDYKVTARPDWFTVPQVKKDIACPGVQINFMLNPREGHKISGTVMNQSGTPIFNATVEAWSASMNIRGDIWSVTDRLGNYELKGLPESKDYILLVSPPKDSSYSFYSEKGISVPVPGETKNIEMTEGRIISGSISDKKTGAPVREASIIAISEKHYFLGKTVSDKNGNYTITNVPVDANCELSVFSENYMGQRLHSQYPGTGVNFALASSGEITGTVKDKTTGELLPGVPVEAYSESLRGLSDFSGVAVTNQQGKYVIKGLKPADESGNVISDYVISVYANKYPPMSKGARKTGDVVDFLLSNGPENEISGTVTGYQGELLEGIDFSAEIFVRGGNYVKVINVNDDGTFKFTGLEASKLYQLKFTAFKEDEMLLMQWAADSGSADYDIGIEDEEDPYQTPPSAKAYPTNTAVHFRFGRSVEQSETRYTRYPKPGSVSELRSTSHVLRDDAERLPSAIASPTHNAVSNNPYITVTWESSGSGYDESYYYEFNQIADHEITMRNAPRMLPVMTKKVTSPELTGDDVLYYFHVAAVDDRGKIGPTASREFRIDTVAPSNGTVLAPSVSSGDIVTLTLGATGVKEMYISNTNYGQGGEWETRVKEKQWKLSDGEGRKEVYVQFRDEAQNVANYLVSVEKSGEKQDIVIENQQFSVDENSSSGTSVGKVIASGGSGALSYAITQGNTESVFAIDSGAGEITVKNGSRLDYENISEYLLTVTVSDGESEAGAVITVSVNDVNEDIPNTAPEMEDQTFSIAENSPKGTLAGKVSSKDAESDDLEYSISEGNTDNAFAIDSATGEITVADGSRLDYEANKQYSLTVKVSDGEYESTAVITINIEDVNEDTPNAAPEIEDQTFSIPENSPEGTLVGKVTAKDSDGDELAYTVTGGNPDNAFALYSETGEIRVKNAGVLDYEKTKSYTLMVQVWDGREGAEAAVTVNITDVDESKLAIKDQTFSVDENSAAGTEIGTVAASGPGDITFRITAGNSDETFAIDSQSGKLTVRNSGNLDYETKKSYILTVEVSDGADTVTAEITVNINDVSEVKLEVKPQTFSLDENSPDGASVGVAAVNNPNGGSLTFRITGGNTDNAFAIDSETGEITVSDGKQLDYETTASYSLTIEVSDGADTASGSITVKLNDLNENKPIAEDQTFSVEENSAKGAVVGTVAASDPDAEDVLTYKITSGNTNSAFAINSETGEITVNNGSELDYETAASYLLTVEISDGANTVNAKITININDVDESRLTVKDQSFSIDENSAKGSAVGTVVASGPSDTLTYRIVEGNTDNAFALNSGTGQITVAHGSQLDYETNLSYTLKVEVSDGADTVSATITINLNDLNEEKLTVKNQSFSIHDELSDGDVVAKIVASGPSEELSYRILSGNEDNVFEIDGKTGEITVADSSKLSHETAPVYTLVVEVSDGEETVKATITINVGKADALINNQTFSIEENSPDGTSVGTVAVEKDDPAVKVTFRITEGNTDETFAINSKTGEITVADGSKLDYETTPVYKLMVEVSDGEKSESAAMTVNVTDVEEDKLVLEDQTFSVNEESQNGTLVGKVKAGGTAEISYRITNGNTDDAFAMNSKTGEITVNDSELINTETTPVYKITVEVSDGTESKTATITINVIKKHEVVVTEWKWQNPIPTGNMLASILPVSDSEFFAVGEAGVILYFDGADWHMMSSGTADNIKAIWGKSRSEIFAAGDAGVILRFDGANWSMMNSGTSRNLRCLWGREAKGGGLELFAAGDAGTILHYDGSVWTAMKSGVENCLYGIWGDAESLFVVGDEGVMLQYDGANWRETNSGVSETLRGLWGNFAVGDLGTILRYDGAGWIAIDSGIDENLYSVWGNSESDVFAAGEYGTMLHYDGDKWHETNIGTSEWLYSVRGGFAAGNNGVILRYDGTVWRKISSGNYEWLKSIWGRSESDMFAVGGGFDYDTSSYYTAILHNDGTGWKKMETDTTEFLYGIWEDFAVGWSGVILRYDGTRWRKMNSETSENLYGIWGNIPLNPPSRGDVFAVGDNGTILHYDGTDWRGMNSETSENLYGICGLSESDIFAVGDKGAILHYDGSEWVVMRSGTSDCLYSVWGSSGSNVFAAGDKGTILHYNGAEWATMRSGKSEAFKDVWGQSADSVFAVGDNGIIFHYNGVSWTKKNSGTHKYLKAVWGIEDTVFVVGDNGTILETGF